jgi:DNA-binding transcriptional LysR family regulator
MRKLTPRIPNNSIAREIDRVGMRRTDAKAGVDNIGVELFRTFLAVNEFRSHKKAAAYLGLSPPAISGHLRRLHEQLGVKIFDNSVPGVLLTADGAVVLESAKEIVDSHDRLLGRIQRSPTKLPQPSVIKIGVPHELRCWLLVPMLAQIRESQPELGFSLRRGSSGALLDELEHGELDICPAVTPHPPPGGVRSYEEEIVWMSKQNGELPEGKPITIVAHPYGTVARDLMLSSLDAAKVPYRITFEAAHIDSAIAAVRRGLGCMACGKSNLATDLFQRTDLPPIPKTYWGIHIRRSLPLFEQLADKIATILR